MARWRVIGAAALCAVVLAACGDSGGNASVDGASASIGANSSADCVAATNAFVAASSSLSLVLGGDDKKFESSVAALNKWAGSAPAAIQKDLKVVAAAYSSYAKALKEAGFKPGSMPDPSLIQAMDKANAVFDSAEFEKANANVDAWFDKECKG